MNHVLMVHLDLEEVIYQQGPRSLGIWNQTNDDHYCEITSQLTPALFPTLKPAMCIMMSMCVN